jgi:acetylornithine deacetylase/succinyl-diaminopimelate desuccinylase-like protein
MDRSAYIARLWDDEILPTLSDYIRIPAKSPSFDPEWVENGFIEQAVSLLRGWAQEKLPHLPGATLEVVRLPGLTPVLLIEVPGEGEDRVLLYGHLDKQPEMNGWWEGFGPWDPVIKDGRLYGRGGADDGYAMFGALAALLALRRDGVPHAPCTVLIEASEESGSTDLPAYMEHLADRIGSPSLVVCLDSGCGDYERLWLTTSLRGMASGELRVDVLEEGVHSGDASGIVPSSFRILRSLLSRIEDQETGGVDPDFSTGIPKERLEQARQAARVLDEMVWRKFPFVKGMGPAQDDKVELILDRTWRAKLAVIGAEGLPTLPDAGNVLRPYTALKLSLRLSPTFDADSAGALLKEKMERNPPYGAKVSFELEQVATGWNAPPTAPWLLKSIEEASAEAWGNPPAMMGEGGSIPCMWMLGDRFPDAQFMVTGVLGPNSNAHGPNEFLDIATGKRVTLAVAKVLADHFRREC